MTASLSCRSILTVILRSPVSVCSFTCLFERTPRRPSLIRESQPHVVVTGVTDIVFAVAVVVVRFFATTALTIIPPLHLRQAADESRHVTTNSLTFALLFFSFLFFALRRPVVALCLRRRCCCVVVVVALRCVTSFVGNVAMSANHPTAQRLIDTLAATQTPTACIIRRRVVESFYEMTSGG